MGHAAAQGVVKKNSMQYTNILKATIVDDMVIRKSLFQNVPR